MKKELPVLNLGHFHRDSATGGFYAETISKHVKEHAITAKPHKHDFFLVVLFTRGSGTHEVDFREYKVSPGALFLLSPGQSHQWTLSGDADGIIFFHTRQFFDGNFTGIRLRDYPFFSSIYNSPLLRLKKQDLAGPAALFQQIFEEYRNDKPMKQQRLLALVNLLYMDVTRLYTPQVLVKSEHYQSRLRQFEDLLEINFTKVKLPSDYAALMYITERHLNRICKLCLDKTPSELILDRNVLEARRLLMQDHAAVASVAAQLGYHDHSYFSRLFKKRTGQTPREFMGTYK